MSEDQPENTNESRCIKHVFAMTEPTDISVLPQRLMRRPHMFQVVTGDVTMRTLHLSDEPMTIGRGTDADLKLPASDLSRRHARLERTRRGFKLTDLESRNGVFVNQVRVQSAILRDGDTVQLGNLQMIYHEGS